MDAIFGKDREFAIVTPTGCGIFITGSDFAADPNLEKKKKKPLDHTRMPIGEPCKLSVISGC